MSGASSCWSSALVTVAVAATIVGAAVATDTPPPANAGFGTAQDQAKFQAPDPHLASQIAALQHRFGRVDVIENQTIAIPGSIDTFDLRAQNPHGPYGQPMLSLVSGHYPAGPGQVAVTSGVAAAFRLRVGRPLAPRAARPAGSPASCRTRRACWTSSPSSSRARSPRRARSPSCSTRTACARARIGPNVSTPHSASSGNVLNPETIVLALATVGHAAHRPGRGSAASRCSRSAGCAPWGCWPPRAPPTGTSVSSSGPTACVVGVARRGGRVRARPGRLAGLPAERGDGRPSRDRPLPAAVDGDRRGHGPGRRRHLLRRLAGRPGRSPGSRS